MTPNQRTQDGGDNAMATTTTTAEPKPKPDDDDPPRVRRVRPALVTCMDGSHALVHLDVDDLGGSRIAGVHKVWMGWSGVWWWGWGGGGLMDGGEDPPSPTHYTNKQQVSFF